MINIFLFIFVSYILYRLFFKTWIRTRKNEGFFLNFPTEMVSGSILEDYYRGFRIIKTLERNEHDYKIFGEISYKGLLNRKPDTRIIYFGGKSDYKKIVFDDHRNISKTFRIKNGEEERREEYEYEFNSSSGKYENKVVVSYKNGVLAHKTFYKDNKIENMVWFDENGREKTRSNFNE